MIIFEDYELELEAGRFNLYRRRPTAEADLELAELLGEAAPAPTRGRAMGYSITPARAVEKIAADLIDRKLAERSGVSELREVFQLWTAELERVRKALAL